MKISAKKYAVVLYQAVTEAKDSDQLLVVKNFVALLSQQNQLALVPQIIEAFEQRWLAGQGGVKVEITTAAPLSTKNQEQLVKQLTQQLQKTVALETKVDPGQLGGIKIKIADTIIDGSLKTQLLNLKNSLI